MVLRLVDHQFKMIGVKMSFLDLPEDEIITVGKKKMKWYDYYLFTEEQEQEWREWCKKEVMDSPYPVDLFMVDMVYGFRRRIIKEGELL